MKKITLLFLFLFISFIGFSQVQNVTFSVSPTTFEESEEITVTVSNVNPSIWGVSDIYLWSWSFDINDENIMDSPTNGTWTSSNEAQKLTNNGDGTFSITLTPTSFYGRTDIGQIGMLVKAKDGSGDKKSQDQLFQVGKFQLTLNNPSSSSNIVNAGENILVSATTSLPANFNLKENGITIDEKTNLSTYNFVTPASENSTYVLEATNNGEVKSVSFSVIVKPMVTEATLPINLKDGINFNKEDTTKATLVFFAPDKDFVHVIGSFNNWEVNNNYLLKKDSAKNRFWIELKDLTPQTNYTYQYLVEGDLKVADPYSTIVLTETNDQFIDEVTYPNLAEYPTGKTNFHVTLLRTGDVPYVWQTTDFQKPKKTDLAIYELLIRDFDELHSFDAVKARLDYLQDLGINAIELMPVMEFDGNLSWGYNPSFHMALDKYYGSPQAFKELIDECHRRGMAIIIDVAFNHASGQNPYYRMWNTDNGGYQGQASADSPFFNPVATHSYSVFNDFNHRKQATRDYVKRITQYWIDEYKIDGFRWDLTKGFTQNCLNNENCTNTKQDDRVEVLKMYADYQWEIDPNFYVIFEHLGQNNEETEWINYRLNEGKGIMVWGIHHSQYRDAALGANSNGKSNFSWMSYKNRGWSEPQNVSYMVSHDEERHMYENLNFGLSNGSYNTKNLPTALERMELNGAFFFTVPGPKMIWQFDELGYDISINQNGRTGNKPILWNYFTEENRKDVYNTWAKLIALKLKYDIFETSDFTIDASNPNGLKKIQLTDASASEIQYINVIGNFGLTTQNINPVFQKTGVWYDVLNEDSQITITNTNSLISLAPGEFRVYANKAAALSTENLFSSEEIIIYPNPVKNSFKINIDSNEVIIFDINGKKVKEFKGDFSERSIFPIDELKKGIYILNVNNSNGKTFKKLIIE